MELCANIATGEVNGIIDPQNATGPSGFRAIGNNNIMERISGKVTGKTICCESSSLSTAAPTAPNKRTV